MWPGRGLPALWRRRGSITAQCPGQHLGFVTVLWCPHHRAGLPWDSLQHTLQSDKGNRGLLSCCPCCHNQFHSKVTDNPVWLSAEGSALGNSGCVSDDAEQRWDKVQQQNSRMGMQLSLSCSEHSLAAVPRATSLQELWVNTSWIPCWKLDQSLILISFLEALTWNLLKAYLYEFSTHLEQMWVTTKTFKVEALHGSVVFSEIFKLLKLDSVWHDCKKICLSCAVSWQHLSVSTSSCTQLP